MDEQEWRQAGWRGRLPAQHPQAQAVGNLDAIVSRLDLALLDFPCSVAMLALATSLPTPTKATIPCTEPLRWRA